MTRPRRADRELTRPGTRYRAHPQFPVFPGTSRQVSPPPPPASMPRSVTRPAAAADTAIPDDAKASRSRSAVIHGRHTSADNDLGSSDLEVLHVSESGSALAVRRSAAYIT